ncbi:MAG: hypothetical protein HY741_03760 [Chloroflexi bacterium]|nr:hypothetical protein [Chloroflexota bacterium]
MFSEHIVPQAAGGATTRNDHFEWNSNGAKVIGKTARGRATVIALKLNNPGIVVARRFWVAAGWWPPQD